jgi:hypothetical protein
MPCVRLSQLSCKVPSRAWTTCAYPSWFVSAVGLNRLSEKPRDRPCVRDITGKPVGTLVIL